MSLSKEMPVLSYRARSKGFSQRAKTSEILYKILLHCCPSKLRFGLEAAEQTVPPTRVGGRTRREKIRFAKQGSSQETVG
ncbi:hypothetical protein F2Q68_00032485 [Brassica cretica]|uniref:Uncharacterized protein n=1 Tax=Brassica cretica TaxID=69181 RepID=A0A8S9GGL0_BRACR|nr:hypothetical protein F2Q68_00032485 [Brassica cretica]